MPLTWDVPLAGGRVARVRSTTTADGDLRVDAEPVALAQRRAAIVDLPWAWLRQVHGADVVVVDEAAGAQGAEADALVTGAEGVALAVQAADCGPLALVSPEGVVAVAHAGWRGTEAGVVEATVAAMRARGASRVDAVLFPCLHVECCAFSEDDLTRLERRFGPGVRGRTTAGSPAFDLPAAIARAVADAGATLVDVVDACTACDPAGRFFSHRAHQDRGRHALVAWIDPSPGSAA